MSMNLSKETKVVRHSNAVSAGQTTITPSNGIDMQGFNGCMFMILWNSITAGGAQSVEAHGSSDDGSSDAYTALKGTKVDVADSDGNKITYLDVYKPQERYLKAIVNRATQDSAIDGIVAILYDPIKKPTAHDADTVSGGETHVSPDEGTA